MVWFVWKIGKKENREREYTCNKIEHLDKLIRMCVQNKQALGYVAGV